MVRVLFFVLLVYMTCSVLFIFLFFGRWHFFQLLFYSGRRIFFGCLSINTGFCFLDCNFFFGSAAGFVMFYILLHVTAAVFLKTIILYGRGNPPLRLFAKKKKRDKGSLF